jgi:hypothetical protein
VAAALPDGSPQARVYEAVRLVRSGAVDEGLRRLAGAAAETPFSTWRVAPLFLYGDLAAEHGRDAEAAAALRRFQALYLPRMMWRAWAWPRSLLRLAQAEARLGHAAAAREALDRLEAAWREAEGDAPLLAEARALRRRLGR